MTVTAELRVISKFYKMCPSADEIGTNRGKKSRNESSLRKQYKLKMRAARGEIIGASYQPSIAGRGCWRVGSPLHSRVNDTLVCFEFANLDPAFFDLST